MNQAGYIRYACPGMMRSSSPRRAALRRASPSQPASESPSKAGFERLIRC